MSFAGTGGGTFGQMFFDGTSGSRGLSRITGLGVSGRTGSPTGWRALGVWVSLQIFVGRDDPCRNSSR